MSKMINQYTLPPDLLLGISENKRVKMLEQVRQRREVKEIIYRFRKQPGIILADEVGMGKTFVALAVGYSVAINNPQGPVVIMTPPNLISKWEDDLGSFCELYVNNRVAINCRNPEKLSLLSNDNVLRYGIAKNGCEFLKLLDDPKRVRSHIILLTFGAMSRGLDDEFIDLVIIREIFRRYGRRERIKKLKKQIHRFLGELLRRKYREHASLKKDKLWQDLLFDDPDNWKDIFNDSLRKGKEPLYDDPVPKAVLKALNHYNLNDLYNEFADEMGKIPLRARGGNQRVSERIKSVRDKLNKLIKKIWKLIIADARWRSPLLILDEAHHLKNPGTRLARQLQSVESEEDMKMGDQSLYQSFERMLFLTATPFQLGHNELIRVLQRFRDVKWDKVMGDIKDYDSMISDLHNAMNEAQLSSIRLFRTWQQINYDDIPCNTPIDSWWLDLVATKSERLKQKESRLIESYSKALLNRKKAETLLKPWVIRHNKGFHWYGTNIKRRERHDGIRIISTDDSGGIEISIERLLPFFLAARSASKPGKDLLGEALSSSYEAFRHTRRENRSLKDDGDVENDSDIPITSSWFIDEFDKTLERISGSIHPKIQATVNKTVDLWEAGEKVLVFAFYRQTCRSLRIHISAELEKRIIRYAKRRLAGAGHKTDEESINRIFSSIQGRYFDKESALGRQALDQALQGIIAPYREDIKSVNIDPSQLEPIMRRFLRVRTTLVRAFPLHEHNEIRHDLTVKKMLDAQDASGMTWRDKFRSFIIFLLQCSEVERDHYIKAAIRTQTGSIRVQPGDDFPDIGDMEGKDALVTLANIQVATGWTKRDARSRLMRAFNTPFFPDILIASKVMGEGVDLHRYCRHVIHHDLDWNPSDIEQRTGRVDRLGCKAEQKHPILLFLPYLSGTADERQYKVMSERESWFKVVMGDDQIAKLIPEIEKGPQVLPPASFSEILHFKLDVE